MISTLAFLKKKFRKHRSQLLVIAVAIVVAVAASVPLVDRAGLLPARPGSAYFYFSGVAEETYLNQVGDVDLHIVSEKTPINSVSAVIKVNPSMVDILGMNTEQSFCSLYLENNFKPAKGEVRISCGTPQPGFSGDSLLVRLRVRYKLPGKTEFRLEPSECMALANDGKGTDILNRRVPITTITIKQTI